MQQMMDDVDAVTGMWLVVVNHGEILYEYRAITSRSTVFYLHGHKECDLCTADLTQKYLSGTPHPRSRPKREPMSKAKDGTASKS
jgi:hypothetical protein